jgi:hypothetical protein
MILLRTALNQALNEREARICKHVAEVEAQKRTTNIEGILGSTARRITSRWRMGIRSCSE